MTWHTLFYQLMIITITVAINSSSICNIIHRISWNINGTNMLWDLWGHLQRWSVLFTPILKQLETLWQQLTFTKHLNVKSVSISLGSYTQVILLFCPYLWDFPTQTLRQGYKNIYLLTYTFIPNLSFFPPPNFFWYLLWNFKCSFSASCQRKCQKVKEEFKNANPNHLAELHTLCPIFQEPVLSLENALKVWCYLAHLWLHTFIFEIISILQPTLMKTTKITFPVQS